MLTVVVLVDNLVQYDRIKGTLERQHREGDIQWIAVESANHGDNDARALNHGLSQATASWIVCAHQDVLFPDGWWPRVRRQIARWEARRNQPVAVAGLVGVTANGAFRGSVCHNNSFDRWPPLPAAVQTIDEHVMILRNDCDLRFDESINSFTGCGADIALQAGKHNMQVIAIDAPVIQLTTSEDTQASHHSSARLLDKWHAHCNGVIPMRTHNLVRATATNAPRRWLVSCNRQLSLARRHWRAIRQPISFSRRANTSSGKRAA